MSAPGRPKRELLPLGGKARSAKGAEMSTRGLARSAGAQITQRRNHDRVAPARLTSVGEVTG